VKPAVRIISTARGGLINKEALLKAIEEERAVGAAIGCFPNEPLTESLLSNNGRIIVTSHLGASTFEAQINVAKDVAEQVIPALQGKTCAHAVNAALISPAE